MAGFGLSHAAGGAVDELHVLVAEQEMQKYRAAQAEEAKRRLALAEQEQAARERDRVTDNDRFALTVSEQARHNQAMEGYQSDALAQKARLEAQKRAEAATGYDEALAYVQHTAPSSEVARAVSAEISSYRSTGRPLPAGFLRDMRTAEQKMRDALEQHRQRRQIDQSMPLRAPKDDPDAGVPEDLIVAIGNLYSQGKSYGDVLGVIGRNRHLYRQRFPDLNFHRLARAAQKLAPSGKAADPVDRLVEDAVNQALTMR